MQVVVDPPEFTQGEQCKKSEKQRRWMPGAEMKGRRYIQEMLYRKAEAFHKSSEMGEEWEVTPPLQVCGTQGDGGAVNISWKRRRLGGFWRIDKEFGFWAVGLQLSTGHPGSAEKNLWIISSGWQLKPPRHELLCQQAPLLQHGWKLLNSWHFLPNFLEKFAQSTVRAHLLLMLTWKLRIHRSEVCLGYPREPNLPPGFSPPGPRDQLPKEIDT